MACSLCGDTQNPCSWYLEKVTRTGFWICENCEEKDEVMRGFVNPCWEAKDGKKED